MVYMKKGATPSKNQQQFKKGKKAVPVKQEEEDNDFDDMDESDDDIDSDEAPQLQRTPANKGIKGRQSLSEKKVSFSIPGKNSPAVKTPKKDNFILVKKQLTPANKGRTSMQEFMGIKGNKVQVKEEDDDEDDEEDDDFEIDEDMEGEDDDLDLDIDEGNDDDDEDDEDDDEEDDDEEDDDEEDEDTIQKKLSLLKQNNGQNKQKTPVKQNDKAKNEESPVKGVKGQTPKKEQSEKASPDPKAQQQIIDEVERRRLRDSKMIYVGGLPNDTTGEELKSLSKEIVDVSLPLGDRKNKAKTVFAFLTFNSEAKAESNYKTLQSKKFRGQPLTLDFVGHKSKNKNIADDTNIRLNLRKLFISGVPMEATIDQVAKYFKTAFQITFNQSPTFRTAVVNFDTDEAAKAAYDANKEITLSGHKLTVLYSRQGGQSNSKKRNNRSNKNKRALKKSQNHGENPAKKMKFSNQRESEE